MSCSKASLSIVIVCLLCSSGRAAEISGTVFSRDGGSLPPGIGTITIDVFTGDDFQGTYHAGSATVDPDDGSYTISALPSGLYHLSAEGNNAVPRECWSLPGSAYHDLSGCPSGATPLLLAEEERVGGKDFYLDLGTGSISGTVYNTDGMTPVTGSFSSVSAYRIVEAGTPPTLGPRRRFSINTDGTYTISYLTDGEYLLSAFAYGQNGDDLQVWWAGPTSAIESQMAVPISVTGEEAVTGKDFILETGASISGSIYQIGGTVPITNLLQSVVVFRSDNPCVEEQWVAVEFDIDDGTYAVQQLPAGSYYLMVYPYNSTGDELPNYGGGYWSSDGTVSDCSGATPITVEADQTVSGKDFQLSPGGIIDGTLYESDGVSPVTSSARVKIYNRDPCMETRGLDYAEIYDSDGSFRFDRLMTGQYYVGAVRRGYADQWWAGGAPVSDCAQAVPISVAAGQTVENRDFVFKEGAVVSGTLFKPGGILPVKGKEIWLKASTVDPCSLTEEALIRLGGAPVDQAAGTYLLSGLSTGAYYLYAYNSLDLEYNDHWWSQTGSTTDCSAATPIVISGPGVIGNTDFQLSYRFSLPGDMNQDGVIGLYDAVASLQAISGMKKHAVSPAGDVNNDHQVGLPEVIHILQAASQEL